MKKTTKRHTITDGDSVLTLEPPGKHERRSKGRTAFATATLKPFPVVSGKYLFWFTPEDVGFSVTCQNVLGVNAQGDTFEAALEHALSMAPFVEECLAEAPSRKTTPHKASRKAGK